MEIPKNFERKEIRCGWTVWPSTKRTWIVEMEMLAELDRICKKYDIKYFAEGGTLLGAVRHGGFIPWDDDVDIAMLREDYDKFCKVAPDEISAPLFFQDCHTDNIKFLFSRIRNSNTAAVPIKGISYYDNTNHGIFIDIFPLDSIPDDETEREKVYDDIKGLKTKLRAAKEEMERSAVLSEIDKYIANLNSGSTSKDYTIYGLSKQTQFIRPKSIYEKSIELPFEWLKISAMEDYETALSKHYGDWHNYVIGSSQHMIRVMDATHPYTDYKDKVPPKKAEAKTVSEETADSTTGTTENV